MPHGHCDLWRPDLLWLNVISDGLIAAAYFSISLAIFYYARQRKNLELRKGFLLFSLFIACCGITHLIAIYVVWNGDYGVHGLSKLVTALASMVTAVYLYRLILVALRLPIPESLKLALESANEEKIKRIKIENQQAYDRTLRESTEAANVGIAMLDNNGVIKLANQALCRIFGYSARELEHKNIYQFVDTSRKERHQNLIRSFAKEELLKKTWPLGVRR